MKISKTLMLATIFSFALATPWITAQPANAQNAPAKATTKKTYNSGQSTTGYTQANKPTPGWGGYSVTTSGAISQTTQNPGLKQSGK